MFHFVRLQPGDSARELAALGLKLKRKNGHVQIIQPCPAHRDAECSIYQARPERCRLFECRQLQRVTSGEITEEAARAKIGEVQRRVAHLDALSRRADGARRRGPLARRCETALAEPFDSTTHPELVAEREALARGMRELDALLDADFRVARVSLQSGPAPGVEAKPATRGRSADEHEPMKQPTFQRPAAWADLGNDREGARRPLRLG